MYDHLCQTHPTPLIYFCFLYILCQPLTTKVNSFMPSKPEAPKGTEPLGILSDVEAAVAPLAQSWGQEEAQEMD